jgi:hypothetical protein
MSTMIAVVETGTGVSMSSREIAELTGKRHDNVLRDIRNLLSSLYEGNQEDYAPEKLQDSALGVFARQYGENNANITAWEYLLDKNKTLTLISGYDVKARMSIFEKLEVANLRDLLATFDATDLPPDRYVYVAMEVKSKRYKIGISKHPEKRVEDLSRMHPEGLLLMAVYRATEEGLRSERRAHTKLSHWRLNGEWFSADAPVAELGQYLA